MPQVWSVPTEAVVSGRTILTNREQSGILALLDVLDLTGKYVD